MPTQQTKKKPINFVALEDCLEAENAKIAQISQAPLISTPATQEVIGGPLWDSLRLRNKFVAYTNFTEWELLDLYVVD